MKLAVVGGDVPFVRRALEGLVRRGEVDEVVAVRASASVGDMVHAAEKVDALVAGELDPGTAMRVPLAAIAAGRSAVLPSWSAADHRDHLELDGDARETGVTIVTGASASPAIPTVLGRHAARNLDECRSVEVAWAMPPESLHDDATARALVEGVRPFVLQRDGGTFSYSASGRAEPVWFPEPVGCQRVGVFGGAEAWRLSDVLPGAPTVRVLLGGTVPWFLMALAPSALAAHRLGRDNLAVALAEAGARIGRMTGAPPWCGVRVEVEGSVGGRSVTRVIGGFENLDTWNAAALTLGVRTLKTAGKGVVVAGSTGSALESLQHFYDAGVRFAAFEPAA